MNIRFLFLPVIMLWGAFSTYAYTTEEEALARIMEFKKCYIEQLTMAPGQAQFDTGTSQPDVYMELHYQTENFNVSDRDELEKLRLYAGRNKELGAFALTDYTSIGDVLNPEKIEFLNEHCYNRPQTFHLLGHGLSDGDGGTANTIQLDNKAIGAEEAAAGIINTLQGYEKIIKYSGKPFTVVVHSCKAGDGEESFAARLSEILAQYTNNFYVVAAPDDVYPTFDLNKGYYEEKIASNSAKAKDTSVEGLPWNVFHGGKLVLTGASTYDRTIDIIEFGTK